MNSNFYGDDLSPLLWGETPPSVWHTPFPWSYQTWAEDVTPQEFMQKEARALQGEYQKIGQVLRDTFVGLHDRSARLGELPGDPFTQKVFEHLVEVDEWRSLSEKTAGDTMGSALATAHIAKSFLANLPEDVRQAIKDVQEKQNTLENAQAQAAMGTGDISEQTLKALEDALQQAQVTGLEAMEKASAQMQAAAWASAESAQQELKGMKQAAEAFGFGWGEDGAGNGGLELLDGIVELAEQLRSHEGLRGLLDALGWMDTMVGEIRGKYQGNLYFTHYERRSLNLAHLAPVEYLGLASDVEEHQLLWMARALDGSLLHKSYAGEDELGKGPFVFVYDTSLSVKPYRSILAAIILTLLKSAREESRRFVAIPFSGQGQYKVFDPGPNPTPQEILEIVGFGYWKGTMPYEPLIEALSIIQTDASMQKADILLLTDGVFGSPSPAFLQLLSEVREEIGLKLVSLVLFTVNKMCEMFSDKVVSATTLDRGCLRLTFENVFSR